MRISDWSSDVCSSGLSAIADQRKTIDTVIAELEELYFRTRGKAILGKIKKSRDDFMSAVQKTGQLAGEGRSDDAIALMNREPAPANKPLLNGIGERSEERRVGKACVSTSSSRWLPYPIKKNIQN